MRTSVGALLAALLTGLLATTVPAVAEEVPPSDVQVLPKHYQTIAYPHELQAASEQYVMHNIHDRPEDDDGAGHSYLTVLRDDGSIAWSDVPVHADSRQTSLVGGYITEKLGESTYWPTAVRFRDVETHVTAGQITMPGNETLAAIGPGWLLTTRPDPNATGFLRSILVIRRLDGTSSALGDVPVDSIPRYWGYEGGVAWVHDGYSGPLFRIDVEEGTASVVPKPEGMGWERVVVGPRAFFNVKDTYDGHLIVTRIDRVSSAATETDVMTGMQGGNPLHVFARGDGLAVYQENGQMDGKYWAVDLDSGTLGELLAEHLSDALPMGGGRVALAESAGAPGAIVIDDGSGPTHVADFPPVPEGSTAIAYDRTLRSTWGDDSTWSIDPDAASPTWTRTSQTIHQRVTSSGGVTLVEELDEGFRPTGLWHLSWPGGQRDVTGQDLRLGHGGQLLVRRADSPSNGYIVERVRTGEQVATADDRGAVADGSWVWSWSSTRMLTGRDVDDPAAPVRTADAGEGPTAAVVDVRGRWVLFARANYTVVDTLGVVRPWSPPGASTYRGWGRAKLGNGFVVWSWSTFDTRGYPTGNFTSVADLSPAHTTRQIADPTAGSPAARYAVDESGGHALAFLGLGSRPRIVRLPWLQQAPTTRDTTAPELTGTDAPRALVGSAKPVATHFGWTFTDSASGVSSYTMRQRTRTGTAAFGDWTTTTSTAAATLDVLVPPGTEVCAQARATDHSANTSDWSEEACSRVDGTPPAIGATSGSARFTTPDAQGGVSYTYRATDASGVGSYDVQWRSAAYGGGLGDWVTARSATTQTTLSRATTPGSEWCFRFRARDLAGNVSGWSAARCSSLAVENTSMARAGRTKVLASSYAGDRSVTQLDASGAAVQTQRSLSGRTFAFWAIAGPSRGRVAVSVGGVRLATVSTRSATTARRLYTVTTHRSGVFRLARVGTGSVAVDAIAIER